MRLAGVIKKKKNTGFLQFHAFSKREKERAVAPIA
jgi:hypothetical protein